MRCDACDFKKERKKRKEQEKRKKKKFEGALGFEPRTYRTAADCSTTELYPQLLTIAFKQVYVNILST